MKYSLSRGTFLLELCYRIQEAIHVLHVETSIEINRKFVTIGGAFGTKATMLVPVWERGREGGLMPFDLGSLGSGVIGGAITAFVTYFSTRAKIRLDLAAAYDKDLQVTRLGVYKELWAMLEPLARYGRVKPITVDELREISDQIRLVLPERRYLSCGEHPKALLQVEGCHASCA